MPPVDRYRTRGHPHGRGAPGPARRLGHDPRRHCGPPAPRSADRHAADPAPAVGTPAPARRWGDPPRPCVTLSRAGASCSPPARDITVTPMEVFPMPTTQIETPYQVITDRILALLAAGHRALAAALGQRDRAAPQPLQPAGIPGHQCVAAHGHGLRLAVLGHVPPGQSCRGERPQGRTRRPCGVLEGL